MSSPKNACMGGLTLPYPSKNLSFFFNFGLSPLEFAIIPLRDVYFILEPHNIVNAKISS